MGKGTECGVLLEGFTDVRPGDVLQCIAIEMVAQTDVIAPAEKQWHL